MTQAMADYILVVDDDEGIRDALSEALQDEGHQVRCATNGNEALALLRSSPAPCLILLDLMMPVMNGWEFRQHQLIDPALSEIPVVVISAAGNLNTAPVPRDRCIPKPITLERLLTVIEQNC
jgi:CheY-like chemotaxis protein